MAKLGECFSVIRNGASIRQTDGAGGFPITRIETIADKTINREKFGYAGIYDLAQYRDYILQDGDILMSHINSEKHLGKIALYSKQDDEQIIHGMNLLMLRADTQKVIPEYAKYYFESQKFLRQIGRITKKSVNQASFTVTALKELEIPLASIIVQRDISEKLKKVDWLVSLRKQQLAKLDELVKARFVEMFGDPIANPKQYKCYTVDDIIQFQGGSQPDKKFFEYEKTPDNIRLIQIRDYRTDKFATYIPTTMAKRFCTAEDIMIGRYGPPIFQILQGLEGSFNVALMKATPKRGNREFIRWFLKQDCLLHYLEGLSKRTAGQDGIQIDKLKAYPFPYPPDELQNEFAAFVERVDQQKQTVQQSLEKLELMKKALMQEYFG